MKLSELVAVHCGKGWRLSKGFGVHLTPEDSQWITDGRVLIDTWTMPRKTKRPGGKADRTHRMFTDNEYRARAIEDLLVSIHQTHRQDCHATITKWGTFTTPSGKNPRRAVLVEDEKGGAYFLADEIAAAMKLTDADGGFLASGFGGRDILVLRVGVTRCAVVSAVAKLDCDTFTPDGANTLPTPKPAIPDRKPAPINAAAVAQVEADSCLPEIPPFVERKGTSAKGRVWVALAPTFHLTRDRYLATLAAVKSVGGWWSVGYPGQPGAFAAWADRRDDLERIVLGAAA